MSGKKNRQWKKARTVHSGRKIKIAVAQHN